MTRKHTPLARLKHGFKTRAQLDKRKAHHELITANNRTAVAAENVSQRVAVEAIVSLGYTYRRARQAVEDYASASAEAGLAPDWVGFTQLVRTHGFADD